ncbi:2-amino-4-hydroxy-6-hydroxymethyldihydropteridine diphosphokinase [Rhizobiales bacterium]|uniref:2-amino-4-hydroxy-6- hydroxymethyldihydropteridine diphosphokinase n=1 Tax=Hongsoonwoonella zoysiae TaxID=2821844 RepID=UPI0015610B40|nr:2-amino-4-hydroxy-6-hydroxymethyldihydropteridine diphosphokinase [Hongsoonwoonella zoysiae]NRG17098.1 2-amino-4-hydroxy-6-hydroxymethyldihydropteridine diphosphokinase [Hongsoonwoonella zoysiae]
MTDTTRAALGLGSNIGDTKSNLDEALSRLSEIGGIEVITRSSDYRTPPWGPVAQDDFRNACAVVETTLPARELLEHCLEVEREMGRVRDQRWGPRLIDIDVLVYGNARVDEEGLSIPHPRMGERAFVLVPLAEIWPDAPIGDGRTATEALKNCPGKEDITRL